MKLFYTKRSPYARKVMVIAIEKEIVIELVEEDLTNKSPELLKFNPIGKIPTLVLDDERSLCDSSLICEHIDQLTTRPLFIPIDPLQKQVILNLDAVAKGLTDITVAAFYEKLLHPEDFHAGFIQNKEDTIAECLSYFEQNLEHFKGLNLAAVSVACAIGYIEFRHGHLWPQNGCERLKQWYDDFSQRDSMLNTVPVG